MNNVAEVKALFNAKAGMWDHKYRPGGALTFRVAAFGKLFAEQISPADKILDLGCGSGAIASALAAGGFRVTACDIAEEMIDVGKRLHAESAIEWHLLRSDWKRLPFDADTFDGIVASSLLEYLPDVETVLIECQRILKPGGVLIATVPDPRAPIRKLENLIRPAAILLNRLPDVYGISKLRSYAAYLTCSRNRVSLEEWLSIGIRAHFTSMDHDKTFGAKSALALLMFHKTTDRAKQ